MREALAHPRIADVLREIVGPNVKCMQSILFLKSAGKPGQAWHQDEHYIPTRDRFAHGGMDRPRRRDPGEWLSLGVTGLAPAWRDLAEPAAR